MSQYRMHLTKEITMKRKFYAFFLETASLFLKKPFSHAQVRGNKRGKNPK